MLEREGQSPRRDITTDPFTPKELVKIRRKLLGVSQELIANQMGMPRSDLSAIESGRAWPIQNLPDFNQLYLAAAKAVLVSRIAVVDTYMTPQITPPQNQ